MPDVHQGYGLPVGGIAATELPDGVVSLGGVGNDINCGARLLGLPLTEAELRPPAGAARARDLPHCSRRSGQDEGRARAVARSSTACSEGLPSAEASEDLERTESEGCPLRGRPLAAVSNGRTSEAPASSGQWARGTTSSAAASRPCLRRARGRGLGAGPRGSADGAHPLGARGASGIRNCTDGVSGWTRRCAVTASSCSPPARRGPASSPEGRAYSPRWPRPPTSPGPTAVGDRRRGARRRRLVLGHSAVVEPRHSRRRTQRRARSSKAKGRDPLVHRKGATRAFPAGSVEIPEPYRLVGQPVFIRQHGHLELRPRRGAGLDRARLREHLPRRRPRPHGCSEAGLRGGAATRARSAHRRPVAVEQGPGRRGAARLAGHVERVVDHRGVGSPCGGRATNPNRGSQRLVPHPAIHAGFWPAITAALEPTLLLTKAHQTLPRPSATSGLSRSPAKPARPVLVGADELGAWGSRPALLEGAHDEPTVLLRRPRCRAAALSLAGSGGGSTPRRRRRARRV